MSPQNDQSKKCFTAFEQASTMVAVVELSKKLWLIAGIVPGIGRHPLKKFEADENRLLALLRHWQQQAVKAGREIKRIVVAFEAGRPASGWRAGSRRGASRHTSSTQRALPHRPIL